MDVNMTKDSLIPVDANELEPTVLGEVSAITGDAPEGGSDRGTIIWSELE